MLCGGADRMSRAISLSSQRLRQFAFPVGIRAK